MSSDDRLYLVRPSLGQPLILLDSALSGFEITVAGKWPAVPGLAACGVAPTAQQVANLLKATKLQLRVLDDNRIIPLSVKATPNPSQLHVYDRWAPFADIEIVLYNMHLPVNSQGVDIFLETVRRQGYFEVNGQRITNDNLYTQCLRFPIPQTPDEYRYAAGFRWDCRIQVGIADQAIPAVARPTMAELLIDNQVIHQAVCIIPGQQLLQNIRIVHLTDIHVSVRNDRVPNIIYPSDALARQLLQQSYRNPNDNLRNVIRNINLQRHDDVLTIVVVTGDMVDYGHDNQWLGPCRPEDSNLRKFIEIVTGGDGQGEALQVPLFVIPGNHEYVRYQVPMSIAVDPKLKDDYSKWVILANLLGGLGDAIILQINRYYTQSYNRYQSYGLSAEQGKVIDQAYGVPQKISVYLALELLQPRTGQFAEYLEQVSFDTDYLIAIGPHRLVFLNTGEDLGVPQDKWAIKDPDRYDIHLLHYLNDQPDNRGITDWHLKMVRSALEEDRHVSPDGSGRTFIFTHAPLINLNLAPRCGEKSKSSASEFTLISERRHGKADVVPNLSTAWLGWLLERLRRWAQDNEPYAKRPAKPFLEELFQILGKGLGGTGTIYPNWQGYEHIDWLNESALSHPGWVFIRPSGIYEYEHGLHHTWIQMGLDGFTDRTTHFKQGSREPGLDYGAAGGARQVHELLCMAAGNNRAHRKVDLVLSGHTHGIQEFRVAPASQEAVGRVSVFDWHNTFTRHVVYFDLDHHVHEIGHQELAGWYHNNLSYQCGAPQLARAANETPWGFAWEGDNSIHIVYIGVDTHVHELSYQRVPGWKHTDLSKQTKAPPAEHGVCGFAWASDKSMHVLYVGENHHIYELRYSHDQGWRLNDLTSKANAPGALGAPTGFVNEQSNTMHVFYLGEKDGHIHELTLKHNEGWRHRDLTQSANAPLAGTRPYGFMSENTGKIHVVYQGHPDHHIHELHANFHEDWSHIDLTQHTGASVSIGEPVGCAWEQYRSLHIVYLGTGSHIHELRYTTQSGWKDTDLTQATATPLAIYPPSIHANEQRGTLQVTYIGGGDQVLEISYTQQAGWVAKNLTQQTGGPSGLLFFSDRYSDAAWSEEKKPVLMTSGSLHGNIMQPRDIRLAGNSITTTAIHPLLKTGRRLSFVPMNQPEMCMRHQNFRVKLTPITSELDMKDATFEIVSGLADPSCVSFESINYPGYFLRHRNFECWLDRASTDDLFKKDATFRPTPGLANASHISFESLNYPGRFIRQRNLLLYLEQGETDIFRQDATFDVIAPMWKKGILIVIS